MVDDQSNRPQGGGRFGDRPAGAGRFGDRPGGGGGRFGDRPGGPGGPGGDRPGGDDRRGGGGRRFGGGGGGGRFFQRRKVDQFAADQVVPDYKDVQRLRRMVSDRAKIEPRRKTGTNAKNQRALTVAIKRARHMALLPFTSSQGR
jgi:small subunit ribosomal protein S18